MHALFLAGLVLCGATPRASGQAPYFEHLGIEDGLSQTTVYAIAKDTLGFMWFATEEGLNRYDGREFRVYRNRSGDSTSISLSAVISLLVDSRGRLWAGTGDGVDLYDARTGQFEWFGSADEGTRGKIIYGMEETADGTIWAASIGAGLLAIDPETRKVVSYRADETSTASLASDVAASVVTCDGTNLWVGTRGELTYVQTAPGGRIRSVRRSGRPDVGIVYDTYCETESTVLFASSTGLFRADTSLSQVEAIPLLPGPTRDVSLFRVVGDGEGGFWVATYGAGLIHLGPGGDVTRLSVAHMGEGGVPDDRIHALFRDDVNTIWVGTASAGVSRWNPLRRRFAHVKPDPTREDALQSPNVWGIADAVDGGLWIGTTSGLFLMDESGSFRRFGERDGLLYEQVHTFAFDAEKTMWVGTYGGVCYLPEGTFRFSCVDQRSLPSMFIMDLQFDSDGDLWLATRSGLGHYRPATGEFEAFNPVENDSTSISSGDVRSVIEDADGDLWLGTVNGVNHMERATGRFTRYLHDPADTSSLSNPVTGAMLWDSRGYLWVGTMGGISILDPATRTFRRLTEDDGLANDVIYGLLEDDAGRVWACSNRGLSRVSLTSGDVWGPVRIRNYSPDDGLQSYEFNLHATHRMSDGRMIFGGVNGFNVFHPDSIVDNSVAPAVALTGLTVRGRPYHRPPSSLPELRLAHDESFFTLSFAALDFVSPSQNRYAYRLEGLDDDWIDAGTRPVATYTSVPPGRYTFRARGSNGDGIWNEAGIALPIIVTPPFWQTWWFRILMLGLLAGVLTLAYNLRIRRLLEVERMRLRIAGDLHDDVGASLGSIILLSDMVRRSTQLAPNDQRRLERIGQIARDMSADLREIVWIVHPGREEMGDLVARLQHVCTTLLDGISHSFEASGRLTSYRLDMSFRRNVLLMFKEILHNVRKHAGASRVDVHVGERAGRLTIVVEDDGTGFDPGASGNGHGLENLRSRSDQMGGEVWLDAAPGRGTRVTVTVPIRAERIAAAPL